MGVVAVIDVGSPKAGKLGWAFQRDDDPVETGSNLDEIVDRMGAALEVTSVALGFEAPLFVPYRNDAMTLTNARAGEGNRPWSAGPGAITNKTFQILASKKPLITMESPAAIEAKLNSGKNCILVPPSNPEKLADAIFGFWRADEILGDPRKQEWRRSQ